MSISRRNAIGILAGSIPALRLASAQTADLAIQKGSFRGTRDSLRAYQVPDWFGDAKFGIWAHWGPQSAPDQGDWYPRNMYIEPITQSTWHRQTFFLLSNPALHHL